MSAILPPGSASAVARLCRAHLCRRPVVPGPLVPGPLVPGPLVPLQSVGTVDGGAASPAVSLLSLVAAPIQPGLHWSGVSVTRSIGRGHGLPTSRLATSDESNKGVGVGLPGCEHCLEGVGSS